MAISQYVNAYGDMPPRNHLVPQRPTTCMPTWWATTLGSTPPRSPYLTIQKTFMLDSGTKVGLIPGLSIEAVTIIDGFGQPIIYDRWNPSPWYPVPQPEDVYDLFSAGAYVRRIPNSAATCPAT